MRHRRGLRAHDREPGRFPRSCHDLDARRVAVRLFRVARPGAFRPGSGGCRPARAGPRGPRGIGRHLPRAAQSCRSRRCRRPCRAQARRAADARRRPCRRRSVKTTMRNERLRPAEDRVGSEGPCLRAGPRRPGRAARPAPGRGYRVRSDMSGDHLGGGRPRCLLGQGRGPVYRHEPEDRAGVACCEHGARSAASPKRHSSFGPGIAGRVHGLRASMQGRRARASMGSVGDAHDDACLARASSPRATARSCRDEASRRRPRLGWRSASTWKAGTPHAGATLRSAVARPWRTKGRPRRPLPPHAHNRPQIRGKSNSNSTRTTGVPMAHPPCRRTSSATCRTSRR